QAVAILSSNGAVFAIGDGVTAATLQLAGSGIHTFADGLSIQANASLIGNGTILGPVTVQPGGRLAPGSSIGKIALSNSPTLQGKLVMEVSKNGVSLTNDQLQVSASLSYGGALAVT